MGKELFQVRLADGWTEWPSVVELRAKSMQLFEDRLGGGHRAGGQRVVVEGQAERGLREHLGRLVIARVAAGDPGVHRAAVALADQVDGEPEHARGSLVQALPRGGRSSSRLRSGRDLGGQRDRARAGAAGGVPQRLGAGVVGVAELRASPDGGAAPLRATTIRSIVGSGTSQKPSSGSRCGVPRTARDERPSGRGSTRRRAAAAVPQLPGARELVDRRVEVPPEKVPPARTTPRTLTGPAAASSWTVCSTPRSCGIESKPHACTIRAPVRWAVAWWARYIRSTNSGSPVRST